MKNNKYNFPHSPQSGSLYNRLEDEEFYRDEAVPTKPDELKRREKSKKKKQVKGHIYYEPGDNEDFQQSPDTVAQHFEDRTFFTHG